jgi:hypothetical protein
MRPSAAKTRALASAGIPKLDPNSAGCGVIGVGELICSDQLTLSNECANSF